MLRPRGSWLNTCRLQLLCTEPLGPHSCIDTTTSPTSHMMKSINAPIMTMAGSRRRLAMSQNIPAMNRIASPPTVM